MSSRFGVASDRVLVHHSSKPGLVVVEDGFIVDLLDRSARIAAPVVDVGHNVVMPALIDTSVHVADPGRSHWEAFSTATAAAAAGGVAAIVDMPGASIPPVATTSAVAHKHAATAGVIRVDVGFWGAAAPSNLVELRQMADAGVFGFCGSMESSPAHEIDPIRPRDLEGVMGAAHALSRPLLLRAVLPGRAPVRPGYAGFLQAHPIEAEIDAIGRVIEAARRTGAWVHLIALSAGPALPMLAAARAEGVIITVETTPHHLTCAAEEIDDDSTVYASVPPIRDSANRDALWDGLVTGTIDMVCSDHFPVPPAARTSRFDTTMPGIAALELRLPLVWTEAARRGIGINQLVQWLCRAPALLGRIHSGRIEPGMRADLVAWDPDAEFVVDPTSLHQRHTHTPFTGRLLRGVVDRTWSAGRLVYAGGSLVGQPGGQILEQL